MGGRDRLRGRYRICSAALVVACAALLVAAPVSASGTATTFTVTGFGDGSGSCAAVADASGNVACTTLRAAVNRANLQLDSPTIYLQAGTYELTAGNGGQLDLATSMSIVGAGPGGPGGTAIAQTDGQHRVLEVDGSTTLSGLEITGGHYSPAWSPGLVAQGGGVLVLGGLTLQNALVTANQAIGAAGTKGQENGDAAMGGGIYYGPGAAGNVISDSTISANTAVGGAGGAGGGAGGLGEGGGLAYGNTGTPLLVQASTLSENTAIGGHGGGGTGPGGIAEGGGVFDTGATGRLVNATIFGNSARGGSASPGGSASGSGGGIEVSGPGAELTLQSDTVDANTASSSAGNLQSRAGSAPLSIHDTILSGGAPSNCGLASSSSESDNLEDDSAETCGFTPANHDLVGLGPQLPASPADYGGPTETLAPAPSSPVLGAGGTCRDPTSSPPNQPLTADQRGEPRPAPCDIGSFQSQPPENAALPTVSGKVSRGQTLICDQGLWSGDGGLSYTFAWLRNGAVVPGLSTNTYVVAAADAGQTLACRVTAAYYGSASATSSFVIVQSYPVITVLAVSAKPDEIALSLGCRGADGTRCKGKALATVLETRRGGRVVALSSNAGDQTVTVGKHSYSIRARHTATLHIALNHEVSHWLTEFGTVPVRLAVNQTTAASTATVASRRVKIRRPGTPSRG